MRTLILATILYLIPALSFSKFGSGMISESINSINKIGPTACFVPEEKGYDDREIAVLLLKRYESLRTSSYWDIKRWSIGWGTKSYRGEKISLEEADRRTDEHFSKIYRSIVKEFPNLTPWQASILSVMKYNVGSFGPQLKKAIRSGDSAQIALVMKRYVYAGGVKLKGLILRRNAEASLLLSSISEKQDLAISLSKIVDKHIEKAV